MTDDISVQRAQRRSCPDVPVMIDAVEIRNAVKRDGLTLQRFGMWPAHHSDNLFRKLSFRIIRRLPPLSRFCSRSGGLAGPNFNLNTVPPT